MEDRSAAAMTVSERLQLISTALAVAKHAHDTNLRDDIAGRLMASAESMVNELRSLPIDDPQKI